MNQKARIAISALPTLMGAYLLFGTLADVTASVSAASWPTTMGTITESYSRSSFSMYSSASSNVSYDYELNGYQYTGYRVAFGNVKASGYSNSMRVPVYYNPSNNSESVLEVGIRQEYFGPLAIGLGLIVIGRVLWKQLK